MQLVLDIYCHSVAAPTDFNTEHVNGKYLYSVDICVFKNSAETNTEFPSFVTE